MKTAFKILIVFGISAQLFVGCSERNAEQEFKRIQDKETSGGDAQKMVEQYQAMVGKYAETKAANLAKERIAALQAKIKEGERQLLGEKEYKTILDAELAGGQATNLVERYQNFIKNYDDTKSATSARERLVALRNKIENEERAAKAKAEQEAKEREALDAELKRQVELLAKEMSDAAAGKALSLHADTEVTDIKPCGKPAGTEDYEKQVWTADITFTVRLRGTILGISTYSEIIETHGEIRINSVTKQFERTVTAKTTGTE
jgi:PBP1b-binding outer membrane lipoprotein LpoB